MIIYLVGLNRTSILNVVFSSSTITAFSPYLIHSPQHYGSTTEKTPKKKSQLNIINIYHYQTFCHKLDHIQCSASQFLFSILFPSWISDVMEIVLSAQIQEFYPVFDCSKYIIIGVGKVYEDRKLTWGSFVNTDWVHLTGFALLW